MFMGKLYFVLLFVIIVDDIDQGFFDKFYFFFYKLCYSFSCYFVVMIIFYVKYFDVVFFDYFMYNFEEEVVSNV